MLRKIGIFTISLNLICLPEEGCYLELIAYNNYRVVLFSLPILLIPLLLRFRFFWYFNLVFCFFYLTILCIEYYITKGNYSQSINLPLYHFLRLTRADYFGRFLIFLTYLYLILTIFNSFTKENRESYMFKKRSI
jgi:hypothetical protein